MKNRERQRANRKLKEERLALRDYCGIMDPTPYEAVKNMIRQEKGAAKKEAASRKTAVA